MAAVILGEEQGVVYSEGVDDMPGKIAALIKSAEQRSKLEQAGLAYVTQVHSNERIAHQLEEKLEEVIREKRKGINNI
jgi:glycosyltransferase involved in cell wall biosynthesis